MSTPVISFAELSRGLIRRGTPVVLDDGRVGWVRARDFSTVNGVPSFDFYEIQLTEGRGTVAKRADQVTPLIAGRAGLGKHCLHDPSSAPGRGPEPPAPNSAA